MQGESTARAARRSGISVQKFHRLAGELALTPVFQATGTRGEKFWAPRDVDRIADHVRQELLDELARLDDAQTAS